MASETARIRARHQSLQKRRRGAEEEGRRACSLLRRRPVHHILRSRGRSARRMAGESIDGEERYKALRRGPESLEDQGNGRRRASRLPEAREPTCSWCAELDECQEEELSELVNKLDERLSMLRGRIERLAVAAPSDSERRKGHRNTLSVNTEPDRRQWRRLLHKDSRSP
ncbi:hypothetical protein MUK42_34801 [Musa troglodytarum]|uniref:Uncharacterized protein n=1 Tax=Musa troglodytarum TaxID=320322 RepID=A0A9E7HXT2_9LILI|nr:hypothetical protein MUK42_34801 [Musa troglodytarum]